MITRTKTFRRRPTRATTVSASVETLAGQHSRFFSSEAQLLAFQRMNILLRYRQLRADGVSVPDAARACGSSPVTLWRYASRFDAGGLQSLEPRYDRCGRKAVADRAGLSPRLLKQLQAISLALGSTTRAFKLFAEMPDCPPNLARIVRHAKSIPPSLKKLVAIKAVTLAGIQSGNQIQLTQQQEIAP